MNPSSPAVELCASLETIWTEHKVGYVEGDILIADTQGQPMLTIQHVEAAVVARLAADEAGMLEALRPLAENYRAYEAGTVTTVLVGPAPHSGPKIDFRLIGQINWTSSNDQPRITDEPVLLTDIEGCPLLMAEDARKAFELLASAPAA